MDNPTPPPLLVQFVKAKRLPLLYGLSIAAVAALLGSIYLGYQVWLGYRPKAWQPDWELPLCIALELLMFVFVATAISLLVVPQSERAELRAIPVIALLAGGALGLTFLVAGVVSGYVWWQDFSRWVAGAEAPKALWHVGVVLLTVVGGLFLMLISLQQARTQERESAGLRRLLYGYNAVLAGTLLLAILVFGNVLVAARASAALDFTAGNLHTLGDRSKNILAGLPKPIRVINIITMPSTNNIVDNLLDNCRAVTDKLVVERVVPFRDKQRADELEEKYPDIEPRGCLLLLYDVGDKEEHRVIKMPEMFEQSRNPNAPPKFKGEDVLMNQIEDLLEGNQKKTIYFTQENGELDLENDRERDRLDVGMGILKLLLEDRKYAVKPLTFSALNPKTPDDAALIVIARPRSQFPEHAIAALRNYMSQGGKMVVFFDVAATPDGKMVKTGLEGFLQEYNVDVGNERIYTLVGSGNTIEGISPEVRVQFDPRVDNNALVKALEKQRPFPLVNCRPIRAVEKQNPRTGSAFTAQPILLTVSHSWAEPDLTTDPIEIFKRANDNPDRTVMKKFGNNFGSSPVPIPVAVAVTESPPFHAGMTADPTAKPRLVVFGDATLLCNRVMTERGIAPVYFGVVTSVFNYLRESRAVGGPDTKQQDFITLGDSAQKNFLRIALLSPALVCLGIVGLGAGLSIVRRR